jgi:hypothetical protein
MKCTVRMWDTYLVSLILPAPLTLQAEGTDAFSQFHLYVCSALLVKFSERLRDMDFQVGSCTSIKTPADLLGNDHVPSMPADADMDRSRYRALALRVVCTQDGLAGGREPLCQPKAERGRFRYARSMTPALHACQLWCYNQVSRWTSQISVVTPKLMIGNSLSGSLSNVNPGSLVLRLDSE